ncbi:exported hypothetical protein [Candidatus Propionivibrio aalborgensis]|uniref:Uncharacterized protein n=1 Tax=Candidatus Propionivibrio aalborgensis TaxID=1860101 RepID=A0A1A8XG46_9RHOO|nr:exported hypothetical protein [Candidatus Propionivibrio aalborgensis]
MNIIVRLAANLGMAALSAKGVHSSQLIFVTHVKRLCLSLVTPC